jgi:hypothetical protein
VAATMVWPNPEKAGVSFTTLVYAVPLPPVRSVNSTSKNRRTAPDGLVGGQPFVTTDGFQILAVNDLGMHCGDLDHRIASILPPFNVIHAQVIQRGAVPQILTGADVDVTYVASSQAKDPVRFMQPSRRVFKTNFWRLNPRPTGNLLAFDAYDPFFPPGILSLFPLRRDLGLPVPDVERLYLGDGQLVADQQAMPGDLGKFQTNLPQRFQRFNVDLPFFINFPFGYTLLGVNWFAAEGIPMTPFDDLGRPNAFPLMRIQAAQPAGGLGQVVATVDTVVPVSAEADCFRCHTSSIDGGSGEAACIPGVDLGCTTEGSRRSLTPFTVATKGQDTDDVPPKVKREWAADLNIIRLHDVRHGTSLEAATPVVCQRCHYTPALDLAHVGPMGPGDADANGREQRIHQTNSRVLHTFHAQMVDLFPNDMPPPNDPQRVDPVTGKPVINNLVLDRLNQTCYQCHPGRRTRCLRGAMFNGGLICQDCHGDMAQVGDDFSLNLPANPFPAGADLNKRVPWANEPGCQSCHTGDVLDNLGLTDPNVIRSTDNVRLLQAYRTNDPAAGPIVAVNRRFAENQIGGTQVLYRLSKEAHSGLACQTCHGSTHAEWPVLPTEGIVVANDNKTAQRLQGHAGTIIECTVCHLPGSLPVSLDGPHGMHPVGDQQWVFQHFAFLVLNTLDSCRTCHGVVGEGSVLGKVAADRILQFVNPLLKGTIIRCDICHANPLDAIP